MTWLLLVGAIATETVATLSMKASEGFTKKVWIAPVLIGYLVAFTLLGAVLAQGMSVGVAYGIWAASGVALTAVLGRLIFRDPLTWMMAAGIALIIGGVLVVELGAQGAH
ncbi:QacE family quaternary ammonium compound efflux SMR transporter [Spongiactinospora rosea]|uniref:QacE family quaternary ammonium compound efflux SMR transporter n=1 Tax=Spongiactinospora rosea TaxID=2248750 RepID=A0A366LK79_9ACTN|nr:multidrug efflux SMR transporter [Spongiactinospora rosea]RBQ14227.1 QacE family quaternary ammonium compound efflux SMR transporter [Spongiactinospora rosea]